MEQPSRIVEVAEYLHCFGMELPARYHLLTEPIDICDHEYYAQSTEQVHDFSQCPEVIFLLTHKSKICLEISNYNFGPRRFFLLRRCMAR